MADTISIIEKPTTVEVNPTQTNVNVSQENVNLNISPVEDKLVINNANDTVTIKDVNETINFQLREIVVLNQGNTGSGTLIELDKLTDFISDNEVLIGHAQPNTLESAAAWKIFRVTKVYDAVPLCDFANGTEEFDKIWNDRLTYTY